MLEPVLIEQKNKNKRFSQARAKEFLQAEISEFSFLKNIKILNLLFNFFFERPHCVRDKLHIRWLMALLRLS